MIGSFATGADVIGATVGSGVMTKTVGALVIGASDEGPALSIAPISVVGETVG